jgi:hypothetical protein
MQWLIGLAVVWFGFMAYGISKNLRRIGDELYLMRRGEGGDEDAED